jgi:hypothetical protein
VLVQLCSRAPSLSSRLRCGKLVTHQGPAAALSMRAAEGQEVLRAFRRGELDVLVRGGMIEKGDTSYFFICLHVHVLQ